MLAVILVLILALLPAYIASRKGRSFGTWYVFGLLLWIVALPASIIVSDERRMCPFCKNRINEGATVCQYCHSAIPQEPEKAPIDITKIPAANKTAPEEKGSFDFLDNVSFCSGIGKQTKVLIVAVTICIFAVLLILTINR